MQACHPVGGAVERSTSKPVAWVTLVLGLDLSYVAAAAVLAAALKRLRTTADCVCMVTPDVPDAARTLLSQVYDEVVEVPYLETLALQKYSERFDDMYNYWLDKSFTKFAMFALVKYEKVIFLDADMLPLENPDTLFDCPAPAGICSSVKDAAENARLHGVPLPQLLIEKSLENGQGNYGVRGCLLIFKPDLDTYTEIRHRVQKVVHYGSLESMVGPDEYLITDLFRDQWHHVHAKYGWVSWADRKDLQVDPAFLHYVSQKPWDEGVAWEDFDYWKNEAKELLKHVPDAIVYFSHITEEMAEMAGVALSDDMKLHSKRLMEEAQKRKAEEKGRREEFAKEHGIDLTSSNGSKSGSWVKGRQDGNIRMTPRSLGPSSARSSAEKSAEATVVKVTPNVLVISNFKPPNGNAKQKDQRPKGGTKAKPVLSNSQQPKQDSTAVKPMVPMLNLDRVHGEAGPKSATGRNGGHWKKKTADSKADVNDWRAPSARLETPDRLSEDLRPSSARNWPGTPPTSSRRGGGYTHSAKRTPTPRSSRADLAKSWRSTPRRDGSTDGPKQSPYGEPRNSHRGAFHSYHERDFCENTRAAMRTAATPGDPSHQT